MIWGFMHVYPVNNWEEITTRQLTRMVASGLADAMETLFVGINGPNEVADHPIFNHPKIEILYCIDRPEIYEALTMRFLHLHCMRMDGDVVFYVHTKGVSRNSPPQFRDWCNMMEYYIIDRYEDCIKELYSSDVAGVNWHLGEGYMGASSKHADGVTVTPHFSGGFWWANTYYIQTLPSLYPLRSKFECEFWIGQQNPEVAELWKSGIHHHRHVYPESNYKGKKYVRYYCGADPIED